MVNKFTVNVNKIIEDKKVKFRGILICECAVPFCRVSLNLIRRFFDFTQISILYPKSVIIINYDNFFSNFFFL